MTTETLNEILNAHRKWLDGAEGGRRANLRGVNLRGVDLSDVNLRGVDLSGADLRGADLRGVNLRDADLSAIRADIFDVLSHATAEAPALLAAIREGRVDGSAYEGACACLVGTIANARGCYFRSLEGLLPDSSRPAERWFLALRPGVTPDTSQVATLTAEWVTEFIASNPVAS